MKDNSINEAGVAAVPESPLAPAGMRQDTVVRFCRWGVRGLEVQELLAAVLGRRESPESVATARRLLDSYPDLGKLAAERYAVLCRVPAVGSDRAVRLLAAFELGFRAFGSPDIPGLVIRRPEDVFPLLREEFRGLDRERFLALYLDTRHRVAAVETVSIGSLNASLVHPREVFKPAVAMSAAAVVVAHNHPSGDPRPSDDDLELTSRLDRCGDLLGIALLDHLVAGGEEIISIREYGWPRKSGE